MSRSARAPISALASIAALVTIAGPGTVRAAAPDAAAPDAAADPPASDAHADGEVSIEPAVRQRAPKLRGYLSRDLAPSARFLDHGVLELSLAGGYPHRYRLGLALGLLDHLTIGVTANWLPRQSRPRFAPRIALAFYRWRWLEFGALYDRSLYPPPLRDDDPNTLSFQRDAHWLFATFAFSQAWLSGGLEIGAARSRIRDPAMPDPDANNDNPSKWRYRFAGGVFLRGGTRRWGFSATARAPWVFVEAAFDVRFGLFELRPKGGWRPQGVVRSTDRRVPTRR